MTTLLNCKKIEKENIKNAVWLKEPTIFKYVRKGNCICMKNELKKEIKKIIKNSFLIGYSTQRDLKYYKKNDIINYYIYWLKDYDLGMPNEKKTYGSDEYKINEFDRLIPTEAITIIKNV